MSTKSKFWTGVALLIIGNLLPLGAVPVAGSSLPVYLKTIIAGFLVLGGPEIFIIAAVAVMGKENYEIIMARVAATLRRIKPAGNVGKLRYTIGLVMFVVPFIPSYIQAYAPHLLPDVSPARLYVNIAADILFLASLFVLGGDFWDKLRSLFVWDSRATFPGDGKSENENTNPGPNSNEIT